MKKVFFILTAIIAVCFCSCEKDDLDNNKDMLIEFTAYSNQQVYTVEYVVNGEIKTASMKYGTKFSDSFIFNTKDYLSIKVIPEKNWGDGNIIVYYEGRLLALVREDYGGAKIYVPGSN